jgi:hypothetical protein
VSQCISELHLQQICFTVQGVPSGWRAVCDCGKPTAMYVLISGALAEQAMHADSHRLCAA